MKDDNLDGVLSVLEARVAKMEKKVLGEEIDSKVQHNVIEEILQLNGQIQRAVANKETVSNLMKRIEEVLEYLELEEGSHLLGGEAKANAILAAEPIIRQMHGIVKNINIKEIESSMNSEEIRKLNSLKGQLGELKSSQAGQEYCNQQISEGIQQINRGIAMLARTPSS